MGALFFLTQALVVHSVTPSRRHRALVDRLAKLVPVSGTPQRRRLMFDNKKNYSQIGLEKEDLTKLNFIASGQRQQASNDKKWLSRHIYTMGGDTKFYLNRDNTPLVISDEVTKAMEKSTWAKNIEFESIRYVGTMAMPNKRKQKGSEEEIQKLMYRFVLVCKKVRVNLKAKVKSDKYDLVKGDMVKVTQIKTSQKQITEVRVKKYDEDQDKYRGSTIIPVGDIGILEPQERIRFTEDEAVQFFNSMEAAGHTISVSEEVTELPGWLRMKLASESVQKCLERFGLQKYENDVMGPESTIRADSLSRLTLINKRDLEFIDNEKEKQKFMKMGRFVERCIVETALPSALNSKVKMPTDVDASKTTTSITDIDTGSAGVVQGLWDRKQNQDKDDADQPDEQEENKHLMSKLWDFDKKAQPTLNDGVITLLDKPTMNAISKISEIIKRHEDDKPFYEKYGKEIINICEASKSVIYSSTRGQEQLNTIRRIIREYCHALNIDPPSALNERAIKAAPAMPNPTHMEPGAPTSLPAGLSIKTAAPQGSQTPSNSQGSDEDPLPPVEFRKGLKTRGVAPADPVIPTNISSSLRPDTTKQNAVMSIFFDAEMSDEDKITAIRKDVSTHSGYRWIHFEKKILEACNAGGSDQKKLEEIERILQNDSTRRNIEWKKAKSLYTVNDEVLSSCIKAAYKADNMSDDCFSEWKPVANNKSEVSHWSHEAFESTGVTGKIGKDSNIIYMGVGNDIRKANLAFVKSHKAWLRRYPKQSLSWTHRYNKDGNEWTINDDAPVMMSPAAPVASSSTKMSAAARPPPPPPAALPLITLLTSPSPASPPVINPVVNCPMPEFIQPNIDVTAKNIMAKNIMERFMKKQTKSILAVAVTGDKDFVGELITAMNQTNKDADKLEAARLWLQEWYGKLGMDLPANFPKGTRRRLTSFAAARQRRMKAMRRAARARFLH